MIFSSFNFRVKQWLEHRVKYIGTLLGNLFALVICMILLCIDYMIDLHCYLQPEAVYTRLTGIASIMISIVIGISLTSFSVIFVVMQLASSQFSPRILRHFLANDVRIQQYIGLFIGTVALCVIPMVVSAIWPSVSYVITLSTGIALALYCLIWSYPRLITYLSVNMNVAAIAEKVKEDLVSEINALYNEKWHPEDPMLYAPLKPKENIFSVEVKSNQKSGYLEHIDYKKLEKLCTAFLNDANWAKDLMVYQKPIVGEYIMQGASVLLTLQLPIEPNNSQKKILTEYFLQTANQVFRVNTFRSYTQDINFGVRKLVDIAIKAISPAVNDPTTCLNCIDQLTDVAYNLQKKRFPTTNACNLVSKNIIVNEFNFDQLIDFCFDQIYQWGKEDPTVVRRLLHSLTLLATNAENPYNLMVIIRQVSDMEIESIYTQQNITERHIKISGEKLNGITNSLKHFEEITKKRISYLQQQGRLVHYKRSNSEIETREQEAMIYLQTFAKV